MVRTTVRSRHHELRPACGIKTDEWRALALTPENTVIGFIGTGVMGRSMARNLMKAGHSLVVYNQSRETYLIDMTTSTPSLAERIYQEAKAAVSMPSTRRCPAETRAPATGP